MRSRCNANRLMLFKEIIIYSKNYAKRINTPCGQKLFPVTGKKSKAIPVTGRGDP
jgi:hypothetical protein